MALSPTDLADYQRPITHNGLFLPHLDLWLDAREPRPFSIISHAHGDHTAQHGTILATPETATITQYRRGAMSVIELPYGQPWEAPDGRFTVTLEPAGHTLGSAQVILDEPGGRRTVYTGDFKLREPLHGPPAPIIPSHILITETTFGKPEYTFPSDESEAARLERLCHEALAAGQVPVVFAYTLGKAQSALTMLLQARFDVVVHGSIDNMTNLYRRLGAHFPGTWERYSSVRGALEGKVLLAPSNTRRSKMVANIKKRRTIYLSGWGMDQNAKWRLGVDEVVVLSDHADWPDLVRYVETAQPQRLYTLHGFPHLAAHFRARGIEATHLETHQMTLL